MQNASRFSSRAARFTWSRLTCGPCRGLQLHHVVATAVHCCKQPTAARDRTQNTLQLIAASSPARTEAECHCQFHFLSRQILFRGKLDETVFQNFIHSVMFSTAALNISCSHELNEHLEKICTKMYNLIFMTIIMNLNLDLTSKNSLRALYQLF